MFLNGNPIDLGRDSLEKSWPLYGVVDWKNGHKFAIHSLPNIELQFTSLVTHSLRSCSLSVLMEWLKSAVQF
jgi:hypothetical protein